VIRLLQVVPRNLVVRRYVVTTTQPCDPKINVGDARVTVHKHYVVVEDEAVDDDEGELGEEGDEHADEARVGGLHVVVVEFEHVAVAVLVGHVDGEDEDEVEDSGQSIPCDHLAPPWREAVNVALADVHDQDPEAEKECVAESAKDNH